MGNREQDTPILVAGGGICGLSTAIALGSAGIPVRILEKTAKFSAEGAGIQIGPNGTRLLQEFGVLSELDGIAVRPDAIDIFRGRSGEKLTSLPIGAYCEKRFSAPYIVVHRHSLHAALAAKTRTIPTVELSLGFDLSTVTVRDDGIVAQGADGTGIVGSGLVGADGIWSKMRTQFFPASAPTFYGKVAWRCVIPTDDAPTLFRNKTVGLWLSDNAHLVHYPLEGGRLINIVAVVSQKWVSDKWSSPGDGDELLNYFRAWCGVVRDLIGCGKDWKRWSLHVMAPLPRMYEGRVVLAGDAAHPMLPFFAQGGVMAIEDAKALATALTRFGPDVLAAWELYDKMRRARVTKVQQLSRRNGHAYHLPGSLSWTRDLVLRHRSPESLLKGFDWVYGFSGSD